MYFEISLAVFARSLAGSQRRVSIGPHTRGFRASLRRISLTWQTRWRSGMDSNPRYRPVRPFFLCKEVDQHVFPYRRDSDSIFSRVDEVIGSR
jgi:hypothetical protein